MKWVFLSWKELRIYLIGIADSGETASNSNRSTILSQFFQSILHLEQGLENRYDQTEGEDIQNGWQDIEYSILIEVCRISMNKLFIIVREKIFSLPTINNS